MKKVLFALAGLVCCAATFAARFDYKFTSTNLAEALSQIAEDHPDLRLNFIYNELDTYRVSANIHTDDPYEALRQVVGLNPVSVLRKGGRYYLEALQHGTFAYTGRLIANDAEPLPGAAVYILAPRDSSVITYGTTDDAGRFVIPCDHSRVLVKFTCMGYLPRYVADAAFNMGTIELKPSPVLLNNLTVEADLVQHHPDRTIYMPTARQKNASSNGIDLLRRMAINQLLVDPMGTGVTTASGHAVVLFINGQPASSEDITGMRMSDVRKVEFLVNPAGAVYQGAQYAVNFIVQEYEYGGYTKISEGYFLQQRDRSNKPSLFSKFSYRKMTYDLYFGADDVGTKHVYSNRETTYRLKDVTITENSVTDKTDFAYIELPVTFRANYKTEKVKIYNTFGYTFHDRYTNEQWGRMSLEPDMGSNYSFHYDRPFVNRTLTWRGGYDLYLPRQWNIFIEPIARYGRNSNYSTYVNDIGGTHTFRNDAKENALYTRIDFSAEKTIADKHRVSAMAHGGYSYNSIDYFGDSPYKSKFNHAFYSLSARYAASLGKFYINTDGGLLQEFTSTNITGYNDPYPFVHVSASFSPNEKNRLSLWFQYATNSPDLAELSPNVVQSTDFLYKTGNPYLRSSRHTTAMLSYNWSPSNKFSLNAYGQFFIDRKRIMSTYDYYNDGAALIRTFINNGNFINTELGLTPIVRLLDNNLVFQASLTFNAYRSTGINHIARNPVKCSFYGAYYFGNFNISAYYQTRQTSLSRFSPQLSTYRSFYSISAGWGNNNWNFNLSLYNFARSSYNYGHIEFLTPLLTEKDYVFNGNYRRAVYLSATYTFGYGKKIQRRDEIGAQGTSSSAILQ